MSTKEMSLIDAAEMVLHVSPMDPRDTREVLRDAIDRERKAALNTVAAGAFTLRGVNRLMSGETLEARKAFLQAVAQATLHAIKRSDEMTEQEATDYVSEVVGCLKGAFIKTGLLKKLPNPSFSRR